MINNKTKKTRADKSDKWSQKSVESVLWVNVAWNFIQICR